MKRILLLPALLCMLSLLGGCELKSGDDLLQVPQPSKNYIALQNKLNEITDKKAVAAAPQSGENRSTVQLVDLDGDGEDEAVAFFRKSTNDNQFDVYVFKKNQKEYERVGSVTGTGIAISSVAYPILQATGERGMVLSWKLGADSSPLGMTVCSFTGGRLRTLLETTYTAYAMPDMDGDGTQELVTVTLGGTGRKAAQLYQYDGERMRLAGESNLSPDARTIDRLRVGRVADMQTAVFAEEKNESGTGQLTDIFVCDEGGFRNIAISTEEAGGQGTYRPVAIASADVNGDQILEVPRATAMSGYQSAAPGDTVYMLDWYVYSASDAPKRVMTTYQNVLENWQLALDDAWRQSITVTKGRDNGMTTTTFSEYRGADQPPVAVLTIYRLTGDLRSYYAQQAGMFEVAKTKNEIFAARIPAEASGSSMALNEENVKKRFCLIVKDWSS